MTGIGAKLARFTPAGYSRRVFPTETLLDLGWSEDRSAAFAQYAAAGLEPARVVAIHRGHTVLHDRTTTVAGSLLHRAESAGAVVLPVVGDWVVVEPGGPIVHVLERRGTLVRGGDRSEDEVLAGNVDLALAVSSLNQDLNLRRLERFVAIARGGDVPVRVLLTKGDLIDDPEAEAERIAAAVGLDAIAISATTDDGLETLDEWLVPRRTTALLGMSGVGKSTLVNRLLGEERQRTLPVRERDDRGRHATAHRELFRLPNGALLLDTPGVRLPRVADSAGLEDAFNDIAELAESCRFRDCGHAGEPGCAVQAAIEAGELDPKRLAALRKLEGEAAYAEARADPAVAAARRARWKVITKEYRRRYDERSGR